jgi:hypothetical protein
MRRAYYRRAIWACAIATAILGLFLSNPRLNDDKDCLNNALAASAASAASAAAAAAAHAEDETQQRLFNFRNDPYHFSEQIISCFRDNDCRIYYLHCGKTGGQDVEGRMFSLFPPRLQSFFFRDGKNLKSFFLSKVRKYCAAKFTSYEMDANTFLETVVPTCMEINTKRTSKSRGVILSTYREPIQRTLSYIHQVCNKNFDRRNKETRAVCKRCSYDLDSDYWDGYAKATNEDYKGLGSVGLSRISNTTVLTIDTNDLKLFYDMTNLVGNHTFFNGLSEHTNQEKVGRCNFGMKSEMIRALRFSSEVYRNLTMGLLGA